MEKKVVIYIRVSTSKQADDGNGLDAQMNGIEEYCRQKEYTYDVSCIFVDAGASAKNLNRPQFIKMVEFIKSNSIKKVIVLKRDRLIRDVLDLYEIHSSLINKIGCTIETVRDGVIGWNTAMEEFIQTVLTAKDKHEIKVTSERTKECMYALAMKKNYPFKGAPLGFNAAKDQYNKKIIVSNKNSIKFIKYAFEHIVESNQPNSGIVAHFNSINLLNKRWTVDSLIHFTKNLIYSGTLVSKSFIVEGYIKPIIAADQQRLAIENIAKKRRVERRKYIYRGVTFCSRCKSLLLHESTLKGTRRGKRSYLYYVCKNCKKRMNEQKISEKLGGQFYNFTKSDVYYDKKTELLKKHLQIYNETNSLYLGGYIDEKSWEEAITSSKIEIDILEKEIKKGKHASGHFVQLSFFEKRSWIKENGISILIDFEKERIIVEKKSK